MSPRTATRAPTPRRPTRRRGSDRETSLNEEVCRSIVGVLFALVRGKVSKKAILQVVTTTLAQMPDEVTLTSSQAHTDVIDIAHVLTVWGSQSPYLHRGKPRPLPMRGRAPSIESLVREAAPHLELATVMHLLQGSNALEKVGRRFVPRSGLVRTRGSTYQATHHMEVLGAVTSNFDHNAAPEALWPSWRAQAAECPRFPIRELPKLQRYIFQQSEQQLKDYDALMRRYERARDPNEPTTRAGVQILAYERSYREQSPEFILTLHQVLRQLGVQSSGRTVRPQRSGARPARKALRR